MRNSRKDVDADIGACWFAKAVQSRSGARSPVPPRNSALAHQNLAGRLKSLPAGPRHARGQGRTCRQFSTCCTASLPDAKGVEHHARPASVYSMLSR